MESLKEQLERWTKAELSTHPHLLGVKATQTESIYRRTLDTQHGKFVVIDRGAFVAALRVSSEPQVQIGAGTFAAANNIDTHSHHLQHAETQKLCPVLDVEKSNNTIFSMVARW